jgi:hypothetical protein
MIPENRTPFSRRPSQAQGGIALTALLGIGLFLMGAWAACARREGTLAGRVVDRSGAGVAEAKVWAIGGTEDEPQTVAETTTDAQGKFVLPKLPPPKIDVTARLRPGAYAFGYDVLARAGDGRLAWLHRYFISQEQPTNIQLDLVEVTDAHGRLVDQAGRPITGAKVIPVYVSRKAEQASGSISALLPATLTTLLHATTTADGSFVVKGLPRNIELGARVGAPGSRTALVYWLLSEPITIILDGRLGRIEGRFKTPDQRRIDGAPMPILRLSLIPSDVGRKFRLAYSRKIQVGPDGSFQFDALRL